MSRTFISASANHLVFFYIWFKKNLNLSLGGVYSKFWKFWLNKRGSQKKNSVVEWFFADKLLSFYLGQSNEPRRKNKQIGSVVCSILAVSEMVCVRWSWQDDWTELNLMFENNSGTKRFRFISEHSLTFADAIQGVDEHKLLIPAISWGCTAP